jgi:hypothetical protein
LFLVQAVQKIPRNGRISHYIWVKDSENVAQSHFNPKKGIIERICVVRAACLHNIQFDLGVNSREGKNVKRKTEIDLLSVCITGACPFGLYLMDDFFCMKGQSSLFYIGRRCDPFNIALRCRTGTCYIHISIVDLFLGENMQLAVERIIVRFDRSSNLQIASHFRFA